MAELLARYRQFFPVLIVALVVVGGTFLFFRRADSPTTLTVTTATPKPTVTPAPIKIDVRGAVANPGVYVLPTGSRVEDALAAAGNLLANADDSKLNRARVLKDGEQVSVPVKGAAPLPTPNSATNSQTTTGKININTAAQAELETLPGIGPTIARNILDYRAQNGAFKTSEELKKVRGIGDAIFERIKDRITVE